MWAHACFSALFNALLARFGWKSSHDVPSGFLNTCPCRSRKGVAGSAGPAARHFGQVRRLDLKRRQPVQDIIGIDIADLGKIACGGGADMKCLLRHGCSIASDPWYKGRPLHTIGAEKSSAPVKYPELGKNCLAFINWKRIPD